MAVKGGQIERRWSRLRERLLKTARPRREQASVAAGDACARRDDDDRPD